MAVLIVPADFPHSPAPIQAAVDAALPGDTILVENGIYKEQIFIEHGKENIHLVAKGDNVVLCGDGMDAGAIAFSLSNIIGVEIRGFLIINYTFGIVINLGGFNRIIYNKMVNVVSTGIQVEQSAGNLLWRNEITGSKDAGISISQSDSNWIAKNQLQRNGYGICLSISSNNALVSNRMLNNRMDGVSTTDSLQRCGRNNFMFENQVLSNERNGIISSLNGVVLDNKVQDNGGNAIVLSLGDSVATGNQIQNNRGKGIEVLSSSSQSNIIQDNLVLVNESHGIGLNGPSDRNLILKNKISANLENGIILDSGADNNKVVQNRILGNKAEDIVDNGANNTFIDNKYQKIQPKKVVESEDIPE